LLSDEFFPLRIPHQNRCRLGLRHSSRPIAGFKEAASRQEGNRGEGRERLGEGRGEGRGKEKRGREGKRGSWGGE